jgi:hypothetical protein
VWEELLASTSNLRNPQMIIYNVPEEIKVDNASQAITAQNSVLNLNQSDIVPKFVFQNKKEIKNLVIEVNSETRKVLKGKN